MSKNTFTGFQHSKALITGGLALISSIWGDLLKTIICSCMVAMIVLSLIPVQQFQQTTQAAQPLQRTIWTTPFSAVVNDAGNGAGTDSDQGQGFVYVKETTFDISTRPWIGGFGYSVALDNDVAVVTYLKYDDVEFTRDGSVYIFERDDGIWELQQILDNTSSLELFGFDLAVAGDTLLIGAPSAATNNQYNVGAGYVFVRNGDAWEMEQKLAASDGSEYDYLGGSVALDGDRALIGAREADVDGIPSTGAAYVYERSDGRWTEQQKLVATDSSTDNYFGITVALDGNTALVGASEAAYIFEYEDGIWMEKIKLTASDGAPFQRFGTAIALDDDTALIGAFRSTIDGNPTQGAVYVFTRDNGAWYEQSKLIADNGRAYDGFGESVALTGGIALIGAGGVGRNRGEAYLFMQSGDSWRQQHKVVMPEEWAGGWFGYSVAIDHNAALIGAPFAHIGLELSGAFRFTRELVGQDERVYLPSFRHE